MSCSDTNSFATEGTSSVATRWGTFVVQLPSCDDSDYNISWEGSNYCTPKSATSQDLQAFHRREEGGLIEQGSNPEGTSTGTLLSQTSGESNSSQVMIKNILNRFTKKEFMKFLDNMGLKGTYNGIYMPLGRTRLGKTSNLGYAFVDFKGASEVALCRSLLDGLLVECPGQQKRIEIAPVTAHHPARKFQKSPKKSKDRLQAFGSNDYYNWNCAAPGSGHHYFGCAHQGSQALLSPSEAPDALPAPAIGGASNLFFSSPPGEFETFQSRVRAPQALDQDGTSCRHIPEPVISTPSLEAFHCVYSV